MYSLPNLLSISRILLILPILILLSSNSKNLQLISIVLFIIAALTDFLDGYLARKTNTESSHGALLDLLADKLLICIVLIYLITQFNSLQYVIPILIIVTREITISIMRQYLAETDSGKKTTPSFLGRVKTFVQILCVPLLILSLTHSDLIFLSIIFLWVSAIISAYSLFDYFNTWRKP
tara:strand:+ start:39359 stop:39895 length:537 start_codon:yes stop_codon:yes gene_type:complete